MTALVRKMLQTFRDNPQVFESNGDYMPEYVEALPTLMVESGKFIIDPDLVGRPPRETDPNDILIDGSPAPPDADRYLFFTPDGEEIDLLKQHLLPWPFELCWFEFERLNFGFLTWAMKFPDNFLQQINLTGRTHNFAGYEPEWFNSTKYTHIGFLRIELHDSGDKTIVPHPCAMIDLSRIDPRKGKPGILYDTSHLDDDQNIDGDLVRDLYSEALLIVKVISSLYSRSVEVIEERYSPKLIAKQRKAGRVLSMDHHRVRLTPVVRRYLKGESLPGERKPKRIHWVRSHIRTLHRDTKQERKVPVVAHLRGIGDSENIKNRYYQMLAQRDPT